MTVHILIETNGTIEHQLVEITKHDATLVDAQEKFNLVDLSTKTLSEKIKTLSEINYEPGDVVCFAGLCLRQFTTTVRNLAKQKKINLMPGMGVDHRLQPIWSNRISRRLPIDKNFYAAWPSLLIIGDVETAHQGFAVLDQLINDGTQACWPQYVPDDPTLEQTLAILSMMKNWLAPDWFKLVDLSVRDLEVVPVMYATHAWHDWIAFYPANGNFKLENHTQLYPVWLAGSLKPLEYWKI